MRSAPRCDALTVAVEVLASAGDLLLNDVVTIPVLAAVRHDHRRIAGLLRIAVLWWTRSGVAAVVVRVAVARLCQIVAARCAIAVVLARRPGHADAHNEHQSRKEPQHLYSSQTRCLNAHLLRDELTSYHWQRQVRRTRRKFTRRPRSSRRREHRHPLFIRRPGPPPVPRVREPPA